MKRADILLLARSIRTSKRSDIWAVSEAIGTILLLGISVTLAGGIAIWTQQIGDSDQGLYVDLWASVQGDELVITHRGGDVLGGFDTSIKLSDSSGGLIEGSYSELKLLDPAPATDGDWSSGETVTIDITSLDDSFEVLIISSKLNGNMMVLMKTDLVRDSQSLNYPDLTLTLLGLLNTDSNSVSILNNEGEYLISVHVSNFGTDMTSSYFDPEADNTFSNLILFDSEDDLLFSESQVDHYDHSGSGYMDKSDSGFGILHRNDRLEFLFTWILPELDLRTLGKHTLTANVVPVPGGEQHYQNNYVSRDFKVDKQILPQIIHGPNPGIYEISFSDRTPNSGDDVLVTVIIQNSGDEPLTKEKGVTMVVSTWSPEFQPLVSDVSYNWKVDYPGFEGEWRSDKDDVALADDTEFPTCIVTDIELLPGAYQFHYFTLEARKDVPGGEQWVYAAIDVYDTEERKEALNASDGDLNDNFALSNIQVLPRIMLVDDDEALTGTPHDMTSSVLESLVGSGVSVNKIFVTQEIEDDGTPRDAPAFDYIQAEIAAPAMEDYDIVIWVTGNVTDPLTNSPNDPMTGIGGNIQEIMKYLDSNRYMMIVGANPFNDLMNSFNTDDTEDLVSQDQINKDASAFLYKYLGIKQVMLDVDLPVVNPTFHGMDLFVDLQGKVQDVDPPPGDYDWNLIISHDGGDDLYGSETYFNIYDQIGNNPISETYSSITITTGEDWSSGTNINIDITVLELSETYDIVITTNRDSGSSIIVYKNQLIMPDTIDKAPILTLANVYQGGILTRDFNMLLHDQTADNNGMNFFVPRDEFLEDRFEIPVGILTNSDESTLLTSKFNSIRSFSSPDPNLFGASYKSVVLAWNISQIKYLNEKVDLFASVLRWFDWEVNVGRDLSITSMKLSIITQTGDTTWDTFPVGPYNLPKYLDTIEIEVTVRNNGPISESTSVMFYGTGPDNIELPITSGIPDPRTGTRELNTNPYDISGITSSGGEVAVFKLWLAVGVGSYTFRVVVDPYNLISEISELNNDISYSTSTVTSFVTQNNILIVDDDMSGDNFELDGATQGAKGPLEINYASIGGEPSDLIDQVLEDLGYDHEVHTVLNDHSTGDWELKSGLGILDLKRYNTVIWVTGDSGDRLPGVPETLTAEDITALKDYLDGRYDESLYLPEDHSENVMLIGYELITDLLDSKDTEVFTGFTISDFMSGYLGLDPTGSSIDGTSLSLDGPTEGEFIDEVFLGMDYNLGDFSRIYSYNTLPVPTPLFENHIRTREGLFAKGPGNDLVATQFENTDTTSRSNCRTLIHSWQLRSLDHSTFESPLVEMMYLALHWFETPDDQPEIMSRDCKIWFENDHPVIGNSFIVIIEIANLGGLPGGGTVRIMDGNTMVKSENIHLDPDSVATIEAIWEPLYAGVRTLEVTLDKHDEHDEVFDVFNNVISQTRRVYFFWDDLETDSGNWNHDSTVMFINGESPIDYLDEYGTPLDTNIVDEWDDTMSHGGIWTRDQYHSSPNSFWLKESKGASGAASDIVLGMIIDNSRSMIERTNTEGDTWLEVAQEAAKGFVSGLSDNSAVCIWKFGGANVVQVIPITSLTGAGRQTVYNAIDSISSGQMTSIWDGIGNAYMSVKAAEGAYPNHLQVVVALSDGADYRSNDHSAMQASKLEAASTDWAPWHDMEPENGYPIEKYKGHVGKYVVPFNYPLPGRWQTAGGASFKGNRMGLLSSDIPIYTIGLGLEHYDPPDSPVTNSYPGDGAQSPHALCIAPGTLESGTTEYNLWRISNTSDAEYFYAPDPDDLADIFDKIGKLLAVPTNQTRGGEPTREDEPEPNEDKWAVTETFDLSSAEDASISFWNKYFMVDGTNGGFLLVGYKDPTVDSGPPGNAITDWDWKVVIPTSGFYTGNLYLGVDRYDSFGNRILWCWNGISGEGTFEWEYVDFDILDYIPEAYRSEVRLNFSYIQYGGGTGFGWYMDDIKLKISRIDEAAVTADTDDMWQYITGSVAAGTTHSGTHAWFAGDLTNKGGDFNDGIDCSLYTRPIDLTNANTARLSAYFKFNIDMDAGRPPDGFRMEVSTDNGLSWHTISLGVRAAWGVSGSGNDLDDGIIDKKAYTGLGDSQGWVNSYTLTRLQTDLDGFIGHSIILRFRVVTNNVDSDHFEDGSAFKGFYVDDIIVYGTSLEQSRNLEEMIEPSYKHEYGSIVLNDDKGSPPPDPPIGGEDLVEDPVSTGYSQETHITLNGGVDENGSASTFWILIGTTFIIAAVAVRRKYIRTDMFIPKGA